MQSSVRRPLRAALTAFLALAFSQAFAATITSATNGDWYTGSTWDGGLVPEETDDVVIMHNVSVSSADAHNLTISAGNLSQASGGELTLTGNFAVAGGSYSAGAGFTPLIMAGSDTQTISGGPSLRYLSIQNSAPTPDLSHAVVTIGGLAVFGELSVLDGRLRLANGSFVGNINIQPNGILDVEPSASITVQAYGNTFGFSNSGTFIHNNSSFLFTGSAGQIVTSDFPVDFYDVSVINTAAVPGDSNDVQFAGVNFANSLSVFDGQAFFQGEAKDVIVGTNGVIKLSGAPKISRDFYVHAGGVSIDSGASLVMNGTGAQVLSGPINVTSLSIQNTAAVPGDAAAVSSDGQLNVTSGVQVSSGQFMPANGESFMSIQVATGAILKPAANAVVTITGTGGAGGLSIDGTVIPNFSTFRFVGEDQLVRGAALFNAEVANSAATPSTANDVAFTGGSSIASILTVTDGQATISGQCNHIVVAADGILNVAAAGASISGNLTNTAGGSVIAESGSPTTFNGSGAQAITGPATFASFRVNNTATPGDATAVTTDGQITALEGAYINDGQFSPATGDSFNFINVSSGAILKPATGSTIEVFGEDGGAAFSAALGTLVHNGSTFRFTGQGQEIYGVVTFHNLEVASPAAVPGPSNGVYMVGISISNQLTISDGMATVDCQARDVVVGADGIMRIDPFGVNCKISGNLTNNSGGTVTGDAGSLLFFNGNGPQTITGPATVGYMYIMNTATVPSDSAAVVSTGGLTTQDRLLVADGQFTPANGDSFRNIQVDGGILKPAAGATINVTGSDGGDALEAHSGGLIANSGTFRFTGSGSQEISAGAVLHNVEVANTAAAPNDSNCVQIRMEIAGTLHVLDGQANVERTVNNIQVDADGILKFDDGGNFHLTGNFVNNGTAIVSVPNSIIFDGGVVQSLSTATPLAFPDLRVAAGTTLNENGTADSTASLLTNSGTIRRTLAVAGTGPLTGGLTAASVDVATQGTLASLVIDRIDSIPNAGPGHVGGKSWTFDVAGATGYTAGLTLPHSLGTPANAAVAKYLGTGTSWYYAQDSSTASTVTRTGLTDLSSRWAVADFTATAVADWQLLAE